MNQLLAMDDDSVASASLIIRSPFGSKYSVQEAVIPDSDAKSDLFFYPWEIRTLPRGNSSAIGAVFIIVNAALGAGLLAFPQAFYNAGGVPYGVLIEVILVVFIIASLIILAYAAEVKQVATYEGIVEQVCGPFFKILAELCVMIFCFGCVTAFLVVIGDQTVDIASAHGEAVKNHWFLDRRFMITVVSVVFILPWLFPRRIGILSYTSFLAVLSCVYITVVVTAKYFLIKKNPSELSCLDSLRNIESTCSRSWTNSLNAIPFICQGFQCHISAVQVYAGLKRRNIRVFTIVIIASVFICLCAYALTGVFGYLTFSTIHVECIESDILRNYCPRDVMVDVARALLGLVMVTSYPILTFCGRTAVDSVVMKLLKLCKRDTVLSSHEGCRLRVISVVWFFLSLALALVTPKISYIFDFTGGLAATFIFFFPGIILLKLSLESTTFSKFLKCVSISFACLLIVLGAFIFGVSFAGTVMIDAHLY